MTDEASSMTQLAVLDYLKKNVSDKVASLFRKSAGLKGNAELPEGSPTISDVFKHYQQTTPKRKAAAADDSTPKAKKVRMLLLFEVATVTPRKAHIAKCFMEKKHSILFFLSLCSRS